MGRNSRKQKYPIDPKKFMTEDKPQIKKDRDEHWSEHDLYEEMLRSKSRHRH